MDDQRKMVGCFFTRKRVSLIVCLFVLLGIGKAGWGAFTEQVHANEKVGGVGGLPLMHVKRCEDFKVTGQGNSPQWDNAKWVDLNKRGSGNHNYTAMLKMLYSKKGVYILFDGTDEILTATMKEDFMDLWHEDVFECFLWPDERYPIYFEYEISPLGKELPIMVPNLEGRQHGWRPWHYEGARKIQKAIWVYEGKPNTSKAKVKGWRAEVFIPYALLKPLRNVPPKKGTRWRANFFRVDYDYKKVTAWDWSRVGPSFHDYKKYGTLVFD